MTTQVNSTVLGNIGNLTVTGGITTVGLTETVYTITGTTPALSPGNGTIQTWTLSANSTPTVGTWNSGQSMTMMIDDGSGRSVTWTTANVRWVGGTAPTLSTTGYTVLQLWKVNTTIYGAYVGAVS